MHHIPSLQWPWILALSATLGCADPIGDLCEAGNDYADTCTAVASVPAGESDDVHPACTIAKAAFDSHAQQPSNCDNLYRACNDEDLERLRRFWACAAKGAVCTEADYVACAGRLDGLDVVCETSLTTP